jgi:hypothetical protein
MESASGSRRLDRTLKVSLDRCIELRSAQRVESRPMMSEGFRSDGASQESIGSTDVSPSPLAISRRTLLGMMATSALCILMTLRKPPAPLREEELASTSAAFGMPFHIDVQTEDMKEPQSCSVIFLNNGFDMQVNNRLYHLQLLSVGNTSFSTGTIQSMLKMVHDGGLTHCEYTEQGLIFHAGDACQVCIETEDTKHLFADLATTAFTEDGSQIKTCNGLHYRFLKIPPMFEWVLQKQGNCSVQLEQLLQKQEYVDRSIAQSLQ